MLLFFAVGFQIVSTTYFQAIGKVGLSIFLSLTRQVIFLMPLLYILPGYFGLNGIWYTYFTSDAAATVVTAALVMYSLRRLSFSGRCDNGPSGASPKGCGLGH